MTTNRIRNMEEFAALSGVSRPTVSKFFNDPDSVRQSTRKRIEEAIERFDYSPNIFAMNQNRKLTRNIGIVVPYLADPFFAEIARRIERRCMEAGYWPILFSSHGQTELENKALATLRSLRPAGALIAPLGKTSDLATVQAFATDIPTVIFDSEIDAGAGFVGSDNDYSIGILVRYLCESGEPPCFLELPPVNPNARKRRRAYSLAMRNLGLEPQIVHVGDGSWDFEQVGLVEGKRLISERLLPSNTIMCSNDRIAIGFLTATYQMGLRVGRGSGNAMRVAGHDDHPWSRFTCPPLTTVAQDYDGIAEQSVRMLFDLLDTGEAPARRAAKFLKGTLVQRESA